MYNPGPIPAEFGRLATLFCLDLRQNKLTGTLLPLLPFTYVKYEERDFILVCFDCVCILLGEFPVSIIKMKTNGVSISLDGNNGFTLPLDIGELDDIGLNLSNCVLTGKYSL